MIKLKVLGVMGFGLLVACGGPASVPDPSQVPPGEAFDGGMAQPEVDAGVDAPTPRHDAGMADDAQVVEDAGDPVLAMCRASACLNASAKCGSVTVADCVGHGSVTVACGVCGQMSDGQGFGVCGDNGRANQCGDACADRIDLRQAGFCQGHGFAANYLTRSSCVAPYKVDRFVQSANPTFHPGGTSGCVVETNAAYGDFLCCP